MMEHVTQRKTATPRNSSLELLRILAMFMIIGFHLMQRNSEDVLRTQPPSISKFLFEMVILDGGWIGNIIFFTISAWFIAGKQGKTPSIKSCCKRAWLLEREVLFWSIILFFASMYFHKSIPSFKSEFHLFWSLTPTLHSLWWYVTCYMIFLLLSPFLIKALKSLQRSGHALLCLLSIGVGSIWTLIPNETIDFNSTSVFIFIYWFILISYYRWYMSEFSTKQCWLLILAGEIINLLYWIPTNYISAAKDYQYFIFFNGKLPTVLIGFSLFLLFERIHFYNRFINCVASTMLGVYLIHRHPVINDVLWTHFFPFVTIWNWDHSFFRALLLILSVLLTCIVLDLIREVLFAISINRHQGHLFEICWNSRPAQKVRTLISQK
ncbi:acyltransferase [Bifidobacterium sp. ESL0763]|uniref:acyltransferase family protein n=1 Tax=Bifidobacterium sp. ESL0763 TaxID=2983227 RepID=UPI0023F9F12C|nr:acyltransferase [Bifidobacterium sp. ESL0763]MDF7663231.1 acyltransferase [Bifidobacterium sp. ESL0763]